jgi:hypothetical protein
MIRWELIILYVLVVSDILFTYGLMYKTKKYKMKGYVEFNPIVRKLTDKYGLHKGIRVSAIYALGLLTICFLYLFWRVPPADFSRMVFFAMGMFTLMNIIHMSSLVVVENAAKKRKKD